MLWVKLSENHQHVGGHSTHIPIATIGSGMKVSVDLWCPAHRQAVARFVARFQASHDLQRPDSLLISPKSVYISIDYDFLTYSPNGAQERIKGNQIEPAMTVIYLNNFSLLAGWLLGLHSAVVDLIRPRMWTARGTIECSASAGKNLASRTSIAC